MMRDFITIIEGTDKKVEDHDYFDSVYQNFKKISDRTVPDAAVLVPREDVRNARRQHQQKLSRGASKAKNWVNKKVKRTKLEGDTDSDNSVFGGIPRDDD